MATKNPEGKRFGKEGQVTKKGTTNANRLLASGLEKPVPSTIEDVKRLKKGLAPAKNVGAARLSPQLAAGRALMRLGSRIAYPVAALDYGHGVGSKIADKYIEKTAEGKVKLSDYAKRRLKEEEDFKAMEKAMQETQPEKKKSQTQEERFRARSREFTGMAAGGSVMTPKMQKKVGTVMKEYKAGSLHSGKGGKVVKNPRQAVAIAMSEARRLKK